MHYLHFGARLDFDQNAKEPEEAPLASLSFLERCKCENRISIQLTEPPDEMKKQDWRETGHESRRGRPCEEGNDQSPDPEVDLGNGNWSEKVHTFITRPLRPVVVALLECRDGLPFGLEADES